jgi:flagellar basal-body rod protein FlgF
VAQRQGRPVARIGLVMPEDETALTHAEGVLMDPAGPVRPAGGTIAQGFLEASNVDAVGQMARLVAVQNAYEAGQGFMDNEHGRIRDLLRLMDQ